LEDCRSAKHQKYVKQLGSDLYSPFGFDGPEDTELGEMVLIYHYPFVTVAWHRLHVNEVNLSSRGKLLAEDGANNYTFCHRSLSLLLTFLA